METCLSNSCPSPSSSSSFHVNDNINTRDVTWRGMNIPFRLRSPISVMMEYSTIMSPTHQDSAPFAGDSAHELRPRPQVLHGSSSGGSGSGSGSGEVEIRIIGDGEQVNFGGAGIGSTSQPIRFSDLGHVVRCDGVMAPFILDEEARRLIDQDPPLQPVSDYGIGNRHEWQQVVKWMEQVLPFFLLLLAVFIRQHLHGFFVSIFVIAVMVQSNEIVKKQTALKGDRNVFVLVGISVAFMLYVIAMYWWYGSNDFLYPLAMIPPKEPMSFWHALFIISVNDALVRQAAMAFKCLLLIYYKDGTGHSFRRQAQMLTLVEYTLLLYRVLLPTPVWFRFFLNKEYGTLFSSLTTGLYLTYKLTNTFGKVRFFLSTLRALSEKDVQLGHYATMEQVNAAGDMCAICQEKMRAPILLSCKHLFCEACVLEWFERERTCPLCRAFIKPADLRTYGDGSTTLLFQLF